MAYQYNSDDRDRRQQEEARNSSARMEQAQHVLEAAAGILDASDWNGQSAENANNSQGRSTTARSNPIAIRRKDDKDEFSSSDEEDGAPDLDLDRLNLNDKSRAAQSLPSQLLRAPHLGSLPTRNLDEFVPAISLSEQQDDTAGMGAAGEDTTVSYGSLRDSQMKGTFLDGPRSLYRDRRTGKLRQRDTTRNVRFQMASSAPVNHDGLSIGERIQQSRKLQKAQNSKPGSSLSAASSASSENQTSSLSAMLESTDPNRSSEYSNTGASPMLAGMMEDYDNTRSGLSSMLDDDDDAMLSTSLTGLEVLQRGLRQDSFSKASPRSSTGISLLSRSLSDPQHMQQQSVFLPSAAANGNSQFLMPPRAAAAHSNNMNPVLPGFLPPAGFPQQQQQQQQQQSLLLSQLLSRGDEEMASDHNPDEEGAFDLDFE